MRKNSDRTKKPCLSFKTYKAIYEPKCNCQPCWNKWVDRIFRNLKPATK